MKWQYDVHQSFFMTDADLVKFLNHRGAGGSEVVHMDLRDTFGVHTSEGTAKISARIIFKKPLDNLEKSV